MRASLHAALLLLAAMLPAAASAANGAAPPGDLSPAEIVAAAPARDWLGIAPGDLLVMDLPADGKGNARRVVIQLIPPPFAQGWVNNIRKFAAAHFWDGTAVTRVQDNYVVQWGDAEADDKAKAKKLPPGLATMPESEYATPRRSGFATWLPWLHDSNYAPHVGFKSGWPIAWDADTAWPTHCYGMVGVGRDMPHDTGTGAELYAVIGHAPRHLDRNIALVGRVIEGIEHLSSLPRGHGALGFYDPAQGDERVGIVSIRPGSAVAGLSAYEYLSTESPSFARYAAARANRRDAFFIHPAGGADLCNIPVPVRRAK